MRIALEEAVAWVEGTKFAISALDTFLLDQIEEEILARVGSAYDTSGWTTPVNTPRIVRVAIAKTYVAWTYRKSYSESLTDDDAAYAALLQANAELIIGGLIDGSIEVPGGPEPFTGSPSFYPTDSSSAMEATFEDPSLGPAKFSMGQVFFYPGERSWPR